MKYFYLIIATLLLLSCCGKPAKSPTFSDCGSDVKFMVDGECVKGDIAFISETLIKYQTVNGLLVFKTAPFKITVKE